MNTIYIYENYESYLSNKVKNINEKNIVFLSSSKISYQKKFNYYENYLNIDEIKKYNQICYNFITNYYFEKSKDLSLYENISYGKIFESSTRLLFISLIKYYFFIKRINLKFDIIYIVNEVNSIFTSVIDANIDKKKIIYKKFFKNDLYDIDSKYRDLSSMFSQNTLANFFAEIFIKILNIFEINNKSKKILYEPSDKLNYFDFFSKKNINHKPILNLSSTLLPNFFNKSFYRYKPFNNFHISDMHVKNDLDKIKIKLKSIINKNFFFKFDYNILDKFIFNFYYQAYLFINHKKKIIKNLKPAVIIVNSDFYESSIAFALVARSLNVKVAHLAHGLTESIFENNYKDNNIFNFYLSHGEQQSKKLINIGYNKSNIILTGYPYYNNFLSIQKQNNKIRKVYKRCIVLLNDIDNTIIFKNINSHINYINSIIDLLKTMNIKIILIKLRHQNKYLSNLNVKDNYLVLKNSKIPIEYGYSNFKDLLLHYNPDFVVGPFSTAFIESSLIGYDYYIFADFLKYRKNFFSNKFIYIANDISVLKKNIIKNKIFKKNYDVFSFIDKKSMIKKNYFISKIEKLII